MRITIRSLRRVIRESLGGSVSNPQIRDAVGPAMADREAIGHLGRKRKKEGEEDELPPHLRDPQEDPEDCRGPIPKGDQDVYAISDPFTHGWSVLPTGR